MRHDEFPDRMWAEAIGMLERAERLQSRFFLPAAKATRHVCWAPPADVFESAKEFYVLVALPDVAIEDIETSLNDHVLIIAGERRLPNALAGAAIRRLELPQGRFERRLAIPAARIAGSTFANGCLSLVLEK
ncbi:MAG: Hsp20/alpha crystallin family protein [Gammaproteobacteria bacterium]